MRISYRQLTNAPSPPGTPGGEGWGEGGMMSHAQTPSPRPSPPEYRGRGGSHRRTAFTIMETVAAFALVSLVLVLVAKVGFTSMKERARSVAKQTALEHLQNLLETARTLPWEKLTPEWASALKLPERSEERRVGKECRL